jgi:hypothetical protein
MSEQEDRVDAALARRMAGGGEAAGDLKRYQAALDGLDVLRQAPGRDPAAAEAGRAAFLEKVGQMAPPVSSAAKERRSGWTNFWRKERSPMTAIVSVALAFLLAFGGVGVTAYAAQDSLPSDPLYGVKLLAEDAQLALTGDPQADFNLLIGFVAERVHEMAALAAEDQAVPARLQTRLEQQLQQALEYAAQLGDQEMMEALTQIRLAAENHVRMLEQMRLNAPDQADDALRLAEQAMNQTRTMAEGGLEDPLTFRQRQGTNRPEDAPTQPEMQPGSSPHGEGVGRGDGPCDNCTPQPTDRGHQGQGSQSQP